MRNIVSIYFADINQYGSCNSASEENELVLSLIPMKTQKTNLRVEVTDKTGAKTTSSILQPEEGYIKYVIKNSLWYAAGTMKIRLLSNEGNTGYVEFHTLVTITDEDAAICKLEVDSFNISKRATQSKDIFPIGSIYMSIANINPAEYFGGTWERYAKGRTLVGVDENDATFKAVKATGGAKTHTLTTSEMPVHTHSQNSHNHTQNSHNHSQNAHGHSGSSGSAGAHTPSGSIATKSLTGYFYTRDAQLSDHNLVLGSPGGVFGVSYEYWSGSHWAVAGSNAASYYKNKVSINASHNHSFSGNAVSAHSHSVTVNSNTASNNATTATNNSTTASNNNTGGGAAHNNLQPYITVYMWVRTA